MTQYSVLIRENLFFIDNFIRKLLPEKKKICTGIYEAYESIFNLKNPKYTCNIMDSTELKELKKNYTFEKHLEYIRSITSDSARSNLQ
jgi:hypothetical protein